MSGTSGVFRLFLKCDFAWKTKEKRTKTLHPRVKQETPYVLLPNIGDQQTKLVSWGFSQNIGRQRSRICFWVRFFFNDCKVQLRGQDRCFLGFYLEPVFSKKKHEKEGSGSHSSTSRLVAVPASWKYHTWPWLCQAFLKRLHLHSVCVCIKNVAV